MVSVIIPAFRAAGYIAHTLSSVFTQSYTDVEVILINDGSPDTPQLVEAIAPWRERVVYLEQENAGAGAARNAGLAAARGAWVAFLDADDRWLPGFLEAQVRFLEAHPEYDVVYADARITGDTPLAGKRFMDTTPSEGAVSFRSLLTLECTVLTSTVVARRSAIVDAGGFDASLRRGQDCDLWLRLAHRGVRIAYQRHALTERVVLADGLSADPVTQLERAVGVLNAIGTKLSLDVVDRELLQHQTTILGAVLEIERGKRSLRVGRFDLARRHFQASIALVPNWKLRLVLAVMGIAPRLFQRAYLRLRPPTTAESLATQTPV
jgi:glycosyltransferase involved in cell wall biosynthesis